MKATHTGTCQVCGREQKLPGGKLSKHGYRVDWGCFVGTCWGADALPFELAKNLIEDAIARAAKQAADIRKECAEVLANKGPEVWYRLYGRSDKYAKVSKYYWGKVTLDGYEYVKDGKRERHHFYGTLEKPAVQQANEAYALVLESRAAKLDQYVEWQQARIKNCKPNPAGLKPIAKDTGPVRHLTSPYYGVWCAGSVMGGQRKQYRTTDPALCTCTRCVARKTAYDARQAAKAAETINGPTGRE